MTFAENDVKAKKPLVKCNAAIDTHGGMARLDTIPPNPHPAFV